jgi:hypothetical protein
MQQIAPVPPLDRPEALEAAPTVPPRRSWSSFCRLETHADIDTAIRVGAGAAAVQALLILAFMAFGLAGSEYVMDVVIYGLAAWFLMTKRSRLAAALPLLETAGNLLCMLTTGTTTIAHVQASPNLFNLAFLAVFVQAFRATWLWQAQRHETEPPSIPAAETGATKKPRRARLIMGGVLGLVLVGIVIVTQPAFWESLDKGFGEGFMKSCVATATANPSVPTATANSYCACTLRRLAGRYTLRDIVAAFIPRVGVAPSTMTALAEAANACVAETVAAAAARGPEI